jgi:hypothetical protein
MFLTLFIASFLSRIMQNQEVMDLLNNVAAKKQNEQNAHLHLPEHEHPGVIQERASQRQRASKKEKEKRDKEKRSSRGS